MHSSEAKVRSGQVDLANFHASLLHVPRGTPAVPLLRDLRCRFIIPSLFLSSLFSFLSFRCRSCKSRLYVNKMEPV